MQMQVLVDLVGDYALLDKAFRLFEQAEIPFNSAEFVFNYLIVLLTYADHEYLTNRTPGPYAVDWHELNLAVDFTTASDHFGKLKIGYRVEGLPGHPLQLVEDPRNPAATPGRLWVAMREALSLLRQIKFIR